MFCQLRISWESNFMEVWSIHRNFRRENFRKFTTTLLCHYTVCHWRKFPKSLKLLELVIMRVHHHTYMLFSAVMYEEDNVCAISSVFVCLYDVYVATVDALDKYN